MRRRNLGKHTASRDTVGGPRKTIERRDETPTAFRCLVIRRAFLRCEWQRQTATAIIGAYREICQRVAKPAADVAVRSIATAEDLSDASFAGQQETFLNIRGERARCSTPLGALCVAVHRPGHQLPPSQGLRSSEGGALDWRPDHGPRRYRRRRRDVLDRRGDRFDKVVLINAAWGPRRECRAGRRRPRRVTMSSSRCSPICRLHP